METCFEDKDYNGRFKPTSHIKEVKLSKDENGLYNIYEFFNEYKCISTIHIGVVPSNDWLYIRKFFIEFDELGNVEDFILSFLLGYGLDVGHDGMLEINSSLRTICEGGYVFYPINQQG